MSSKPCFEVLSPQKQKLIELAKNLKLDYENQTNIFCIFSIKAKAE